MSASPARASGAKIYFATNRRMHGLWQTNIPSRFLDELPERNVEVTEVARRRLRRLWRLRLLALRRRHLVRLQLQHAGLAARPSRRRLKTTTASPKPTPITTPATTPSSLPRVAGRAIEQSSIGWGFTESRRKPDEDTSSPSPWRARDERIPRPRLPLTIEGELVAKSTGTVSAFTLGDRVFHQKFGNGNVTAIDGNKLTIQFDRAGEKRVVDSFVERV